MARRAIKIWTEAELDLADSLYWFDIDGDNLEVHTYKLDKCTLHNKHEKFTLLMTKIRRIAITPLAMEMFESLMDEYDELSLIRVQNACNIMEISYRPITKVGVKRILDGEERNL